MGKYALTRSAINQRKTEGSGWNMLYNSLPKASDFSSEYEYYLAMSNYPFIGGYFEARAKQLEYNETQRWWSDYAKHTGIDLSKNPYPIRSGYYRGFTSPYAETFEATEAIMSLYGLKKLW